jgi:hypothetical protein
MDRSLKSIIFITTAVKTSNPTDRSLLNNAVSTAAVIFLLGYERVVAFSELERTGKKAVVSGFKILSQH